MKIDYFLLTVEGSSARIVKIFILRKTTEIGMLSKVAAKAFLGHKQLKTVFH